MDTASSPSDADADLARLKEKLEALKTKRRGCSNDLTALRANLKDLRKDTDKLLKEQSKAMAFQAKRR